SGPARTSGVGWRRLLGRGGDQRPAAVHAPIAEPVRERDERALRIERTQRRRRHRLAHPMETRCGRKNGNAAGGVPTTTMSSDENRLSPCVLLTRVKAMNHVSVDSVIEPSRMLPIDTLAMYAREASP